ncbi:unnamed protein product [Pleuronectes platessa]|uniref:Uncharacterized protein n=1 Tax=Pleuronectes platessa TaxID=8262 RepID=A0A9N7YM37_PLEPL|nr:unnamed protein product [Pleuronectes platessa]
MVALTGAVQPPGPHELSVITTSQGNGGFLADQQACADHLRLQKHSLCPPKLLGRFTLLSLPDTLLPFTPLEDNDSVLLRTVHDTTSSFFTEVVSSPFTVPEGEHLLPLDVNLDGVTSKWFGDRYAPDRPPPPLASDGGGSVTRYRSGRPSMCDTQMALDFTPTILTTSEDLGYVSLRVTAQPQSEEFEPEPRCGSQVWLRAADGLPGSVKWLLTAPRSALQ